MIKQQKLTIYLDHITIFDLKRLKILVLSHCNGVGPCHHQIRAVDSWE